MHIYFPVHSFSSNLIFPMKLPFISAAVWARSISWASHRSADYLKVVASSAVTFMGPRCLQGPCLSQTFCCMFHPWNPILGWTLSPDQNPVRFRTRRRLNIFSSLLIIFNAVKWRSRTTQFQMSCILSPSDREQQPGKPDRRTEWGSVLSTRTQNGIKLILLWRWRFLQSEEPRTRLVILNVSAAAGFVAKLDPVRLIHWKPEQNLHDPVHRYQLHPGCCEPGLLLITVTELLVLVRLTDSCPRLVKTIQMVKYFPSGLAPLMCPSR